MSYSFTREKLTVEVCADRAELGALAGVAAARYIREAISERGEARVIFAAAPSQNETLATLCAASDVDWSKVIALHMDEYIGLPIGSNARFSYYLKKHCFDILPFKAIYYLDEQDGLGVEEMQARYESILNAGPIDLVCMGIGENGHVAFNDPPVADFNDPRLVKVVELDDVCRNQQVNDGCFPNFASTPTHALSLTVPALCRGKYQVCAVPGKQKAEAVKKTLNDPISTACPATIMRTLPGATLYVDSDSYSLCRE